MPMDVATRVALIKRLAGDIHGRLSESSSEDLNAQSACSEWDVGTVAAHLAGGAVRQQEAMQRGLAGEGGPPSGETILPTPDQVQASNATSNVQTRHDWGDDLLDNFRQNYADLGRNATRMERLVCRMLAPSAGHNVGGELRRPQDPGTGDP